VTCRDVERGNIAEECLLGRLPEEAASEFETHYFDCPACLARVELLEGARTQLESSAAIGRGAGRYRRAIPALAAAAVLVLTVGVIREVSRGPASAPVATPAPNIELPPPPAAGPARGPDLRSLGEIERPRFDAPRLRVSPSALRRVFLQALERYERGDCQGALAGLETAARQDPKMAPAHFFLGTCSLELDRNADAVRHLANVVKLGESPYLEDAHFFLAKAHIRLGDLASARKELEPVIALDGDRRAEASSLLSQIR
jgi:tetratricopeptide (TPR) repeat protein